MIILKYKRLQIYKAIFSRQNNAGGITVLDLKLYYRIIVTKTAWYWYKQKLVPTKWRNKGQRYNPIHL